jgi:hypothetical protein
MQNRKSGPGDSGGPWFWGQTAYGLHQGWKAYPLWWNECDLFTMVVNLPSGIGVTVLVKG